ncbi:hypothetical protein JCM17823_25710 [Halorubrum gandharaense]
MADGDGSDRVLLVDDEPDVAELAATYLDRLLDDVETVVESDTCDALDRVRSGEVDCVVSDYDMPGHNGLELLVDVREAGPEVPFILFTGKGSEEIASEAISAGVTDYLQKGVGTEQYEMLAKRVDNALQRRRAEERSRVRGEAIGRYETILATLQDPVFTLDDEGEIAYSNGALAELTGRSPDELRGSAPARLFAEAPPATVRRSPDSVADLATDGTTEVLVSGRDGPVRCEMRASRVRGEADALAFVLRDVSDRTRAEAELQAVNRKVTAIHAFATDVSGAGTEAEVFERVIEAAERILEFDRCITARREGDRIYPAALSDNVGDDEVRTFEVGEAIAGRTVAEGRTFVIDDPINDENADPVGDDIGSAISVPIGQYGLFQALSGVYGEFDDEDVEFAELIASHAGEAIEQLRTETALREERDRLAALFDNLPLPAARILVDPDGSQTLDAVNDAFEATFGFDASDDYETVVSGIVPDDQQFVSPDEAFDDDEPIQVEVQRRTTDGVVDFVLHGIPIDNDGERLVYSVFADIGDHKRVERTLRGLHEATREMFHAEGREAVAQVAARAAIDTLGFPNSGVRLYDPDENVLSPSVLTAEARDAIGDRPAFGPGDGEVWTAFETGEPVHIGDLDAVETVGDYGELRSLLAVPLGEHGVMPLGALEPEFFQESDVQLARVLAANVTAALDRAERAEQLRKRDAALERELDRLEKFAGVVSHDLRNPLNVATGRLALVADAVDDEAVLDDVERVEAAHDRMERLIDDLLALARQGRTVDDPEPVALAAVTRRAWRTVDTDEAVLEPPANDVRVDADPERLRTLLENLIRNAVEHGAAADRERPLTLSVTGLPEDGGFAVADDGTGLELDPEEAFQYGVSTRTGGTGFGLAIVREIAAAHGWELDVETDDGTRFVFRI